MVAAMPAAAVAQLNESVQVEGRYLKDVILPVRPLKLPARVLPALEEPELDYEFKGVNVPFIPWAPAVGASAVAYGDTLSRRGYVDLSMGSWLDTRLLAGVSLLHSDAESLSLRLGHNSTSLWRPYGKDSDRRYLYDESLGIDYSRIFAPGRLDVSAQYRLSAFNYYAMTDPQSQTLNDASLRLAWNRDAHGDARDAWHAGIGARYFGYRTGTRETQLRLFGDYARRVTTSGIIGADISAEWLLYGAASGTVCPDAYGTINVLPYYSWRRKAISLRVGVALDFTFNADGSDPQSHYGAVHAAPDVKIDVTGKSFGFYAHFTGGQRLHTLSYISTLDAWCNPVLSGTQPSHTPVDARIGFDIFPWHGIEAGLYLRYNTTRNAPMGGWNEGMLRYDVSGIGGGARLAWKLSDVFGIEGEGTYVHQNGESGIFNGLDRPRWTLNARATVRPVSPLLIALEYEYRGVRNFYEYDYSEISESEPEPQLQAVRLPDLTRLNASVTWHITPRIMVGVQGKNLLNRAEMLLPGLKAPGLTVLGRFGIIF